MTKEEFEKLVEEFKAKLESGEELTHEEKMDYFSKFSAFTKDLEPNQASDDMIEFMSILANPLTDEQKAQIAKEKKTSKFVSTFLNTALAVGDIAIAKDQIKTGRAMANASKRPATPPKYRLNPTVSKSIRDTVNAMSPTGIEAQLSPLKQDITDAYRADIENAKIAAGGQAGSFASQGQAAVNRRLRNAGKLNTQRLAINSDLRRNLNYALQNRINEQNSAMRRDLSVYGADLQQYNRDQVAAGQLEAAGRENLRNSIYGLAPLVAEGITTAANTKVSPREGRGGWFKNLRGKLFDRKNTAGINDYSADGIISPAGTQPILDKDSIDFYDYNNLLDRNMIEDTYLQSTQGIYS